MKNVEIAEVPIEHHRHDTRYFVMVDMTDHPQQGITVFHMLSPDKKAGWDLWFPDRATCVEQMQLCWGILESAWKPYSGPEDFDLGPV